MAEIKKENLEKALGDTEKRKKVSEMPREVEIGFHQGALNTLINERNELIKLIQQIERVMQAHIKRLEELGVKIKKVNANDKN
jgi:argininosuccinate synthase